MWFRRAFPWLFAVAIAAGLFELVSLTILPWKADVLDFDAVPTSRPFVYRIDAVPGTSRATGIVVGDTIDTRELLYANHFATMVAGTPYTVIAHRGAKTIRTTLVPVRLPMPWDQGVRLAGVFWVLMFAFLIYRKGGGVKENDYLILTLVLLTLQSSIGRTPLPDGRLELLYAFVASSTLTVMMIALAFYGMQFRGPIPRWRQGLFYAAVLACGLAGTCHIFANVNALVAPLIDLGFGIYPWIATLLEFTIPLFLALLTIVTAIPYAPPADRQRLAWVSATFVPWVVGVTLGGALPDPIWYTIENISFFVIPAGLTYAALSRRLFDVGFVLNRAAVFAGVSAIVVGAFVLAEWALSEWLRNASHTTNLAASGALALTLGLSVRFVHTRVDRFVDVVFFRKRHDDERALRTFAHEAPYITNAATLLQRTRDIVQQHTGAQHVTVLQCDALGPIDENDPALVTLRASRKPLDLHDLQTELRGEIALPMVARGRLVGALVLGPKVSHESYAPDESAALVEIAHSVGLSLDVLAGSRTSGSDALEEIRRTSQRILDVLLTMQNASLETR